MESELDKEVDEVRSICKPLNRGWLGTAVVVSAAVFAAVHASLWEASAFLPALIAVWAVERRRDR